MKSSEVSKHKIKNSPFITKPLPRDDSRKEYFPSAGLRNVLKDNFQAECQYKNNITNKTQRKDTGLKLQLNKRDIITNRQSLFQIIILHVQTQTK